ncbi:anti-sigma regulatory factor (Ser/Thr protein kinase) [Nocardia sp. GP40]
MSDALSGSLQGLSWLVGVPWPDADTRLLQLMEQGLDDVANQLQGELSNIDSALGALTGAIGAGDTRDGVQKQLQTLRSNVADQVSQYQQLSSGLHDYRGQIQEAQHRFEVALSMMAAQFAWAALAGPEGPLMQFTALARTRLLCQEIGQWLVDAIANVLERIPFLSSKLAPFIYAAGSQAIIGGLQGAAQEAANELLNGQGLNWGKIVGAAEDGAEIGAIGGLVGHGLHLGVQKSFGDDTGWKGAVRGAAEGAAAGGIAAGAGTVITGLNTGNWQFDPRAITGGMFAGAGQSAIHGYRGFSRYTGEPFGKQPPPGFGEGPDGTGQSDAPPPAQPTGGDNSSPGTPGQPAGGDAKSQPQGSANGSAPAANPGSGSASGAESGAAGAEAAGNNASAGNPGAAGASAQASPTNKPPVSVSDNGSGSDAQSGHGGNGAGGGPLTGVVAGPNSVAEDQAMASGTGVPPAPESATARAVPAANPTGGPVPGNRAGAAPETQAPRAGAGVANADASVGHADPGGVSPSPSGGAGIAGAAAPETVDANGTARSSEAGPVGGPAEGGPIAASGSASVEPDSGQAVSNIPLAAVAGSEAAPVSADTVAPRADTTETGAGSAAPSSGSGLGADAPATAIDAGTRPAGGPSNADPAATGEDTTSRPPGSAAHTGVAPADSAGTARTADSAAPGDQPKTAGDPAATRPDARAGDAGARPDTSAGSRPGDGGRAGADNERADSPPRGSQHAGATGGDRGPQREPDSPRRSPGRRARFEHRFLAFHHDPDGGLDGPWAAGVSRGQGNSEPASPNNTPDPTRTTPPDDQLGRAGSVRNGAGSGRRPGGPESEHARADVPEHSEVTEQPQPERPEAEQATTAAGPRAEVADPIDSAEEAEQVRPRDDASAVDAAQTQHGADDPVPQMDVREARLRADLAEQVAVDDERVIYAEADVARAKRELSRRQAELAALTAQYEGRESGRPDGSAGQSAHVKQLKTELDHAKAELEAQRADENRRRRITDELFDRTQAIPVDELPWRTQQVNARVEQEVKPYRDVVERADADYRRALERETTRSDADLDAAVARAQKAVGDAQVVLDRAEAKRARAVSDAVEKRYAELKAQAQADITAADQKAARVQAETGTRFNEVRERLEQERSDQEDSRQAYDKAVDEFDAKVSGHLDERITAARERVERARAALEESRQAYVAEATGSEPGQKLQRLQREIDTRMDQLRSEMVAREALLQAAAGDHAAELQTAEAEREEFLQEAAGDRVEALAAAEAERDELVSRWGRRGLLSDAVRRLRQRQDVLAGREAAARAESRVAELKAELDEHLAAAERDFRSKVDERVGQLKKALATREAETKAKLRVAELKSRLDERTEAYREARAEFESVGMQVLEDRFRVLQEAGKADVSAFEAGLADRADAFSAAEEKEKAAQEAFLEVANAYDEEVWRSDEVIPQVPDAVVTDMVNDGTPVERFVGVREYFRRDTGYPADPAGVDLRDAQSLAIMSRWSNLRTGEGKSFVTVVKAWMRAREFGRVYVTTSGDNPVNDLIDEFAKFHGSPVGDLRVRVDRLKVGEALPDPDDGVGHIIVCTMYDLKQAVLHEQSRILGRLEEAGASPKEIAALRRQLNDERPNVDEMARVLDAAARRHKLDDTFAPFPAGKHIADELDTLGDEEAVLVPGASTNAEDAEVKLLQQISERVEAAAALPQDPLTAAHFGKAAGTRGFWPATVTEDVLSRLNRVPGVHVIADDHMLDRYGQKALALWGPQRNSDYIEGRGDTPEGPNKIKVLASGTNDKLMADEEKGTETRYQGVSQFLDLQSDVPVKANLPEKALHMSDGQLTSTQLLQDTEGHSGTAKVAEKKLYDQGIIKGPVREIDPYYVSQVKHLPDLHFDTSVGKLHDMARNILRDAKVELVEEDGQVIDARITGLDQVIGAYNQKYLRGDDIRLDEYGRPVRAEDGQHIRLTGWEDKHAPEKGVVDWLDQLTDQKVRAMTAERGLTISDELERRGIKLKYNVLDARFDDEHGGGAEAERVGKEIIAQFGNKDRDEAVLVFVNKGRMRGTDYKTIQRAIDQGGLAGKFIGGAGYGEAAVIQGDGRIGRSGKGPRETGGTPGTVQHWYSREDYEAPMVNDGVTRQVIEFQHAVETRQQAAAEHQENPTPETRTALTQAYHAVQRAVHVLREQTTPTLQRDVDDHLAAIASTRAHRALDAVEVRDQAAADYEADPSEARQETLDDADRGVQESVRTLRDETVPRLQRLAEDQLLAPHRGLLGNPAHAPPSSTPGAPVGPISPTRPVTPAAPTGPGFMHPGDTAAMRPPGPRDPALGADGTIIDPAGQLPQSAPDSLTAQSDDRDGADLGPSTGVVMSDIPAARVPPQRGPFPGDNYDDGLWPSAEPSPIAPQRPDLLHVPDTGSPAGNAGSESVLDTPERQNPQSETDASTRAAARDLGADHGAGSVGGDDQAVVGGDSASPSDDRPGLDTGAVISADRSPFADLADGVIAQPRRQDPGQVNAFGFSRGPWDAFRRKRDRQEEGSGTPGVAGSETGDESSDGEQSPATEKNSVPDTEGGTGFSVGETDQRDSDQATVGAVADPSADADRTVGSPLPGSSAADGQPAGDEGWSAAAEGRSAAAPVDSAGGDANPRGADGLLDRNVPVEDTDDGDGPASESDAIRQDDQSRTSERVAGDHDVGRDSVPTPKQLRGLSSRRDRVARSLGLLPWELDRAGPHAWDEALGRINAALSGERRKLTADIAQACGIELLAEALDGGLEVDEAVEMLAAVFYPAEQTLEEALRPERTLKEAVAEFRAGHTDAGAHRDRPSPVRDYAFWYLLSHVRGYAPVRNDSATKEFRRWLRKQFGKDVIRPGLTALGTGIRLSSRFDLEYAARVALEDVQVNGDDATDGSKVLCRLLFALVRPDPGLRYAVDAAEVDGIPADLFNLGTDLSTVPELVQVYGIPVTVDGKPFTGQEVDKFDLYTFRDFLGGVHGMSAGYPGTHFTGVEIRKLGRTVKAMFDPDTNTIVLNERFVVIGHMYESRLPGGDPLRYTNGLTPDDGRHQVAEVMVRDAGKAVFDDLLPALMGRWLHGKRLDLEGYDTSFEKWLSKQFDERAFRTLSRKIDERSALVEAAVEVSQPWRRGTDGQRVAYAVLMKHLRERHGGEYERTKAELEQFVSEEAERKRGVIAAARLQAARRDPLSCGITGSVVLRADGREFVFLPVQDVVDGRLQTVVQEINRLEWEFFSGDRSHLLAAALHALTGWKVVAFDREIDGKWQSVHYAVRTPEGELLDIVGKAPPIEVERRVADGRPVTIRDMPDHEHGPLWWAAELGLDEIALISHVAHLLRDNIFPNIAVAPVQEEVRRDPETMPTPEPLGLSSRRDRVARSLGLLPWELDRAGPHAWDEALGRINAALSGERRKLTADIAQACGIELDPSDLENVVLPARLGHFRRLAARRDELRRRQADCAVLSRLWQESRDAVASWGAAASGPDMVWYSPGRAPELDTGLVGKLAALRRLTELLEYERAEASKKVLAERAAASGQWNPEKLPEFGPWDDEHWETELSDRRSSVAARWLELAQEVGVEPAQLERMLSTSAGPPLQGESPLSSEFAQRAAQILAEEDEIQRLAEPHERYREAVRQRDEVAATVGRDMAHGHTAEVARERGGTVVHPHVAVLPEEGRSRARLVVSALRGEHEQALHEFVGYFPGYAADAGPEKRRFSIEYIELEPQLDGTVETRRGTKYPGGGYWDEPDHDEVPGALLRKYAEYRQRAWPRGVGLREWLKIFKHFEGDHWGQWAFHKYKPGTRESHKIGDVDEIGLLQVGRDLAERNPAALQQQLERNRSRVSYTDGPVEAVRQLWTREQPRDSSRFRPRPGHPVGSTWRREIVDGLRVEVWMVEDGAGHWLVGEPDPKYGSDSGYDVARLFSGWDAPTEDQLFKKIARALRDGIIQLRPPRNVAARTSDRKRRKRFDRGSSGSGQDPGAGDAREDHEAVTVAVDGFADDISRRYQKILVRELSSRRIWTQRSRAKLDEESVTWQQAHHISPDIEKRSVGGPGPAFQPWSIDRWHREITELRRRARSDDLAAQWMVRDFDEWDEAQGKVDRLAGVVEQVVSRAYIARAVRAQQDSPAPGGARVVSGHPQVAAVLDPDGTPASLLIASVGDHARVLIDLFADPSEQVRDLLRGLSRADGRMVIEGVDIRLLPDDEVVYHDVPRADIEHGLDIFVRGVFLREFGRLAVGGDFDEWIRRLGPEFFKSPGDIGDPSVPDGWLVSHRVLEAADRLSVEQENEDPQGPQAVARRLLRGELTFGRERLAESRQRMSEEVSRTIVLESMTIAVQLGRDGSDPWRLLESPVGVKISPDGALAGWAEEIHVLDPDVLVDYLSARLRGQAPIYPVGTAAVLDDTRDAATGGDSTTADPDGETDRPESVIGSGKPDAAAGYENRAIGGESDAAKLPGPAAATVSSEYITSYFSPRPFDSIYEGRGWVRVEAHPQVAIQVDRNGKPSQLAIASTDEHIQILDRLFVDRPDLADSDIVCKFVNISVDNSGRVSSRIITMEVERRRMRRATQALEEYERLRRQRTLPKRMPPYLASIDKLRKKFAESAASRLWPPAEQAFEYGYWAIKTGVVVISGEPLAVIYRLILESLPAGDPGHLLLVDDPAAVPDAELDWKLAAAEEAGADHGLTPDVRADRGSLEQQPDEHVRVRPIELTPRNADDVRSRSGVGRAAGSPEALAEAVDARRLTGDFVDSVFADPYRPGRWRDPSVLTARGPDVGGDSAFGRRGEPEDVGSDDPAPPNQRGWSPQAGVRSDADNHDAPGATIEPEQAPPGRIDRRPPDNPAIIDVDLLHSVRDWVAEQPEPEDRDGSSGIRVDRGEFARVRDLFGERVLDRVLERIRAARLPELLGTSDRELAQQLTEKVFESARNDIAKVTPGRDVGAWLVARAQNVVAEQARFVWLRHRLRTAYEALGGSASTPEGLALAAVSEPELRNALTQLRRVQSSLLKTLFERGTPIADAARTNLTTESDIRRIVNQAIGHLVEMLIAGGLDESTDGIQIKEAIARNSGNLLDAVRTLSHDAQFFYRKWFLESLPIPQIADEMNKTEFTVKVLRYRVVRTLSARLTDGAISDGGAALAMVLAAMRDARVSFERGLGTLRPAEQRFCELWLLDGVPSAVAAAEAGYRDVDAAFMKRRLVDELAAFISEDLTRRASAPPTDLTARPPGISGEASHMVRALSGEFRDLVLAYLARLSAEQMAAAAPLLEGRYSPVGRLAEFDTAAGATRHYAVRRVAIMMIAELGQESPRRTENLAAARVWAARAADERAFRLLLDRLPDDVSVGSQREGDRQPVGERRAAELWFLQERSLAETAAELGCGTVRTVVLLYRAVHRLAAWISEGVTNPAAAEPGRMGLQPRANDRAMWLLWDAEIANPVAFREHFEKLLTSDERRLLELRYMQGLSRRGAPDVLSIRPASAHTREQRSVDKIVQGLVQSTADAATSPDGRRAPAVGDDVGRSDGSGAVGESSTGAGDIAGVYDRSRDLDVAVSLIMSVWGDGDSGRATVDGLIRKLPEEHQNYLRHWLAGPSNPLPQIAAEMGVDRASLTVLHRWAVRGLAATIEASQVTFAPVVFDAKAAAELRRQIKQLDPAGQTSIEALLFDQLSENRTAARSNMAAEEVPRLADLAIKNPKFAATLVEMVWADTSGGGRAMVEYFIRQLTPRQQEYARHRLETPQKTRDDISVAMGIGLSALKLLRKQVFRNLFKQLIDAIANQALDTSASTAVAGRGQAGSTAGEAEQDLSTVHAGSLAEPDWSEDEKPQGAADLAARPAGLENRDGPIESHPHDHPEVESDGQARADAAVNPRLASFATDSSGPHMLGIPSHLLADPGIVFAAAPRLPRNAHAFGPQDGASRSSGDRSSPEANSAPAVDGSMKRPVSELVDSSDSAGSAVEQSEADAVEPELARAVSAPDPADGGSPAVADDPAVHGSVPAVETPNVRSERVQPESGADRLRALCVELAGLFGVPVQDLRPAWVRQMFGLVLDRLQVWRDADWAWAGDVELWERVGSWVGQRMRWDEQVQDQTVRAIEGKADPAEQAALARAGEKLQDKLDHLLGEAKSLVPVSGTAFDEMLIDLERVGSDKGALGLVRLVVLVGRFLALPEVEIARVTAAAEPERGRAPAQASRQSAKHSRAEELATGTADYEEVYPDEVRPSRDTYDVAQPDDASRSGGRDAPEYTTELPPGAEASDGSGRPKVVARVSFSLAAKGSGVIPDDGRAVPPATSSDPASSKPQVPVIDALEALADLMRKAHEAVALEAPDEVRVLAAQLDERLKAIRGLRESDAVWEQAASIDPLHELRRIGRRADAPPELTRLVEATTRFLGLAPVAAALEPVYRALSGWPSPVQADAAVDIAWDLVRRMNSRTVSAEVHGEPGHRSVSIEVRSDDRQVPVRGTSDRAGWPAIGLLDDLEWPWGYRLPRDGGMTVSFKIFEDFGSGNRSQDGVVVEQTFAPGQIGPNLQSARHTVDDALVAAGIPAELRDDVELAVSEYLQNVERHSRADRKGGGTLRVRILGNVVRVEVDDAAPGLPERHDFGATLAEAERDVSEDEDAAWAAGALTGGTHSFGVRLIEAAATATGVDVHPVGKTVWAEFRIPDGHEPANENDPSDTGEAADLLASIDTDRPRLALGEVAAARRALDADTAVSSHERTSGSLDADAHHAGEPTRPADSLNPPDTQPRRAAREDLPVALPDPAGVMALLRCHPEFGDVNLLPKPARGELCGPEWINRRREWTWRERRSSVLQDTTVAEPDNSGLDRIARRARDLREQIRANPAPYERRLLDELAPVLTFLAGEAPDTSNASLLRDHMRSVLSPAEFISWVAMAENEVPEILKFPGCLSLTPLSREDLLTRYRCTLLYQQAGCRTVDEYMLDAVIEPYLHQVRQKYLLKVTTSVPHRTEVRENSDAARFADPRENTPRHDNASTPSPHVLSATDSLRLLNPREQISEFRRNIVPSHHRPQPLPQIIRAGSRGDGNRGVVEDYLAHGYVAHATYRPFPLLVPQHPRRPGATWMDTKPQAVAWATTRADRAIFFALCEGRPGIECSSCAHRSPDRSEILVFYALPAGTHKILASPENRGYILMFKEDARWRKSTAQRMYVTYRPIVPEVIVEITPKALPDLERFATKPVPKRAHDPLGFEYNDRAEKFGDEDHNKYTVYTSASTAPPRLAPCAHGVPIRVPHIRDWTPDEEWKLDAVVTLDNRPKTTLWVPSDPRPPWPANQIDSNSIAARLAPPTIPTTTTSPEVPPPPAAGSAMHMTTPSSSPGPDLSFYSPSDPRVALGLPPAGIGRRLRPSDHWTLDGYGPWENFAGWALKRPGRHDTVNETNSVNSNTDRKLRE